MSCWSVLGISPTKNINKIKAAYVELNSSFTENSEEYINLKKAYNKALSLATASISDLNLSLFKSSNFDILSALINSSIDNTTVDSVERFINKVEDIYKNPVLRFNKEIWIDLLSLPILNDSSLNNSLEENLINFIFTHKFLPHNIYILLDSRFNWQNRENELSSLYSTEIVTFLMNSILNPLPLTYDYLSDINPEKLDEYLLLREKAFLEFQTSNEKYNKSFLFDAYSIYTKDLDLLKLLGLYYLNKNDNLMALNYFREAINISTDDLYCLSKFGHLLTKTNQYSKAIYYLEKYLKKLRNNIDIESLIDLAYCYYYSYDLQKAKDLFDLLIAIRPWDLSLKMDLEAINNKISKDISSEHLNLPIYKKYLNPYLNPFIDKLNEIYNNFSFRINSEKWGELFTLPIASNDTLFYLIEQYIIKFITINKNIPKNIFLTLNSHFCWLDRHDELLSIYPHLNIDLLFDKLYLNETLSYTYLNNIDPNNLEEYVNARESAYTFLKTNNKLAKEYLDKALKLYNGDFELYKLYGEYYLYNNMYNKAIESFKLALSIKPDEYYSCCSLGVLLTKTEHYSEALHYLQQSVNTTAGSMLLDNEDFLTKYAICYYYSNDLINAKKYFKELYKINPSLNFINIYLKNINCRLSGKKVKILPIETISTPTYNTNNLKSKTKNKINLIINKLLIRA